MAKKGRFQQQKTKRRGGFGRILLILLLAVVIIVTGAVAAGAVYYNSMLNLITRPEATEVTLSDEQLEEILGFVPEKIEIQEAEPVVAETQPESKPAKKPVKDNIVNIMLIGQQARKNETAKLSDTMILCSINKDTKTITLTSFLRDLYVKLPNFQGHLCGKNRINVAYNLGWYWAGEKGGMEMLDQLILDTFGVEVDYNIEIGFESFKDVINTMGGVDIELTAPEAGHLKLGKAGIYHLDGEKALGYARIRSIDNDFNRTARQRKLVTALINKCKQMSISELNNLIKTVLPMVITDMTNEEITTCALEFVPMVADLKIESNQVPAEGTYRYSMLDIVGVESNVIICDEEENGRLLRAIAEPSEEN